MDDDGKSNGLLDAARGLANAFSDLLNSLKPGEGKVGTSYQRVFKAYFSTAKLQETQNYIDLKKTDGLFQHLTPKHIKNNCPSFIQYSQE